MNYIKYLIFCFIIVFISCKDEKKQTKKEEEIKSSKDLITKNKDLYVDNYQLEINLIIENEDLFQVFFSEDYSLSFLEENSILKEINPSIESQKLVFDLPEGIIPDRFRIDIGRNPSQGKIKIENMIFRLEDKELLISGDLLQKYLIPNIFINYNEGFYYLNSANNKYDPYFLCSPELIRLLFRL